VNKPDTRIDDLDGIARELALVAGYDAAEALILAFGGQRLYVPNKMRPSSPFWKVLGGPVAKQLALIVNGGAGERTGNDVDIPLGSRLMQAKRKAAIAGFKGSKNQAVAVFKCSRRTVQRYRKKVRHDPATQLDLGLAAAKGTR
jgi:hypothetical protein